MVKELVPRIHFYDQDFVSMYDRCWMWIGQEWKRDCEKIPTGYITYQGSSVLDLFEVSLSSLFLVYSNQNYSPEGMLDYFYSFQSEDGYIPERIDLALGKAVFDKDNPKGVTLPLLSYVEYVLYHKIGNKRRLREIVSNLERYYTWLEKNFLSENGFYKVPLSATKLRNLPREGAVYTVDFNSFVAIFALYMADIGDILNDKELTFRYKRIYFSLKTRINSLMWDENDGIYYDLDGKEKRVRNKHIGSYWTLMAEIPNEEQGAKLIDKLKDGKEFGTENPFPTVPMSSKYAKEKGDGYKSGVVPFCTYMVVKGMIKYEEFIFARECCIRHFYFILDTFNPEKGVGDVWEIYKPNSAGSAASTIENRKRYLAMNGLALITLVIENIIGLDISLPRKTTYWTMQKLEEMGVEELSLKRNNITILSNKNSRGWEIRLESEKLYYFTIEILEESKKKTLPIPSGKCSMFIDKL